MRRAFLAGACALGGLALLVVRLRATYMVVRVRGGSMAPTLTDGDRLLSRRTHLGALRHGEVAVVRYPLPDGGKFLIKRVAALPGDPVPEDVRKAVDEDVVPAGRFVLLGDNTEVSFDSREHGFFHAGDLHAVTIRRLDARHAPLSASPRPSRDDSQWCRAE
ncbi:S26 family signal peptidase [Nonomuraea mesophila]|uniref:S26 family signal peptidase n=1 Tax=Nonomuraea mesophila TaxID=2530382 RepID=A0A4R5FID2_9ACTN|nr:S26 family signal peptidase [Nonomuraea mesophila]TDE51523.1 S26 family signal peptidase [Nonomuraea mesophila]